MRVVRQRNGGAAAALLAPRVMIRLAFIVALAVICAMIFVSIRIAGKILSNNATSFPPPLFAKDMMMANNNSIAFDDKNLETNRARSNIIRHATKESAKRESDKHDRNNSQYAEYEEQLERVKQMVEQERRDTESTHARLLSWIKQQQLPNDSSDDDANNVTTLHQFLLSSPFYFTPGTLPLSQLETLRMCYTHPEVYRKHFKFQLEKRKVSYSAELQLAYIPLPKCGSSTGRYTMEHEFGAVYMPIEVSSVPNVVSFVREPLSRFYSQYDEVFFRTAPWYKPENPYYVDRASTTTGKAKSRPHPFPYMHENMHTHGDYERAYCPEATRRGETRVRCRDVESNDNGTLASRLERFVEDWDGLWPFDQHLALQTPLLSWMVGYPVRVTELYNTTNSAEGWKAIARKHGGHYLLDEEKAKKRSAGRGRYSNVRGGEIIKGRALPRRFNVSLVGERARRRICELTLLDYCCLNFPLPRVCATGRGEEEGGTTGGANTNRLLCKLELENHFQKIRIQPGMFPDKRNSK